VSPTFAALKALSVSAYLRTYATIALKEAEGIAGGNPCMRCRSVSAYVRTDAAHALEEEVGDVLSCRMREMSHERTSCCLSVCLFLSLSPRTTSPRTLASCFWLGSLPTAASLSLSRSYAGCKLFESEKKLLRFLTRLGSLCACCALFASFEYVAELSFCSRGPLCCRAGNRSSSLSLMLLVCGETHAENHPPLVVRVAAELVEELFIHVEKLCLRNMAERESGMRTRKCSCHRSQFGY